MKFQLDFMGKRVYAMIGSGVFLVICVISLLLNGLNLGLDFTGGAMVEVGFAEEIDPELVRDELENGGFSNGTVQYFGSNRDLLVRIPPVEGVNQSALGDEIYAYLLGEFPGTELRQSSYVGPAVGEELAEDGGLALLAALIVVMLYILFRFTKQFSVGAVSALVHDVLIVIGLFSIFGWTFDLTVLAALFNDGCFASMISKFFIARFINLIGSPASEIAFTLSSSLVKMVRIGVSSSCSSASNFFASFFPADSGWQYFSDSLNISALVFPFFKMSFNFRRPR